MGAPRVRPMEHRDVEGVHAATTLSFDDLTRRLGDPPPPPGSLERARIRLGRLLATDPGGAWVAEHDGRIVGCALGIVRGGLWGLSLLAVVPEAQSAGTGRELLARARAHGDGARGWAVLASRDPRALRAYAALGLTLHPAMIARGPVRDVSEAPAGVRPWAPADAELAASVDHAIRGAPHGRDLDAIVESGSELLVLPGRGYAAADDGSVKLVAAHDEDAAATLLRAALATGRGGTASVEWITSAQAWAVPPCLEAGLELHAVGAVCLGGDVGRFAPYLPSGPYL